MKPKIYTISFAKVYPLLVAKAERKSRTKKEVDAIIFWLTGYDNAMLSQKLQDNASCELFFLEAPALNPNRKKITGLICGVRVEDIKEPVMQEIRYLDKLVDELAKGKSLETIYRHN